MSISNVEVEQIAKLAKLRLEAGEVDEMARDLGSILEHIRELQEAELESGMTDGAAGSAPMRNDLPIPDPLHLSPEQLAPEFEAGFFVVPRLSALDADLQQESGSA